MEIFINNEKKEVPEGTTIEALVDQMKITDKAGLAVAVNQKVIPRKKWAETTLNSGDKLLLITATFGG
jgi:sulfur carrier protein